MPIIQNQASLSYSFGDTSATVLSNIATATLEQAITAAKTSLETTYRAGDTLTFILSVTNSSASTLTNVTLTDNLGAYTVGSTSVTPYTFTPDALLFIGGVDSGVITPAVGPDSITFTIPSLPGNTGALIVYQVTVNDLAPLSPTSTITNTAVIRADGLTDSVTASRTVTAGEYADVAIVKNMSPSTIVDGGQITYSFEITNSGNAAAENVVLRDAFDPAPTAITVRVNGQILDPSAYSYAGGVLTIPNATGDALRLPAAEITQDPLTGVVTVTPSSLLITVTGTL